MTALTEIFSQELCEIHDVENAVFLVDTATIPKLSCNEPNADCKLNVAETGTASNVSSRDKTPNVFVLKLFQSTSGRKQPKIGFKAS